MIWEGRAARQYEQQQEQQQEQQHHHPPHFGAALEEQPHQAGDHLVGLAVLVCHRQLQHAQA